MSDMSVNSSSRAEKLAREGARPGSHGPGVAGGMSSGAGRDESGLVGEDDGLNAVAQAQLAQDRAEVRLHRPLGEVEPSGDLLVAEALADGDEDLALAVGEAPEPLIGPACRARVPRGLRREPGREPG